MTTTQQISRAMYFAGLRSGIREAMDDLNGVRRALIDSAYLPSRTAEMQAASSSIESASNKLYLLLRQARDALRTAADSFRDTEGNDNAVIPAPTAGMGERFAGSWRGIIADPEQPQVHDQRAMFDGVPYQAWVDRFGPPNSNGGTEWVLRTPAGPATIYTTKSDTGQEAPVADATIWCIGGHSDVVVAQLDHALSPDVQFKQHDFTPSSSGPNGTLNVYSELAHWLTEAGLELRDVQGWLNSEWVPDSTQLAAGSAAARDSIVDLIQEANELLADAQATAQEVLEPYCATATAAHGTN